jgi:hypothetical protein
MTLPTTRQITDTAMAYGRLTGHIRAFLPVINIDAHGNVSGLDTLKEAIETIAQKRSTKELRKHDDEQENGKAKEAIKVLRQTLRRITRKDIEKGGLGIDITFEVKDCICTFYIHESKESEESEENGKRDILTTLAQKLDASEVPDSVLEMIAEEMRKLSV